MICSTMSICHKNPYYTEDFQNVELAKNLQQNNMKTDIMTEDAVGKEYLLYTCPSGHQEDGIRNTHMMLASSFFHAGPC